MSQIGITNTTLWAHPELPDYIMEAGGLRIIRAVIMINNNPEISPQGNQKTIEVAPQP